MEVIGPWRGCSVHRWGQSACAQLAARRGGRAALRVRSACQCVRDARATRCTTTTFRHNVAYDRDDQPSRRKYQLGCAKSIFCADDVSGERGADAAPRQAGSGAPAPVLSGGPRGAPAAPHRANGARATVGDRTERRSEILRVARERGGGEHQPGAAALLLDHRGGGGGRARRGRAAALLPRLRRHSLRLPLRGGKLRGLQSLLQTHHTDVKLPGEHRVHLPGEQRVRDKQAQAQGVPGVPVQQVPADGHAAGGRAAGPRARRPPEVPARGRRDPAASTAAPPRRHQGAGGASVVRTGTTDLRRATGRRHGTRRQNSRPAGRPVRPGAGGSHRVGETDTRLHGFATQRSDAAAAEHVGGDVEPDARVPLAAGRRARHAAPALRGGPHARRAAGARHRSARPLPAGVRCRAAAGARGGAARGVLPAEGAGARQFGGAAGGARGAEAFPRRDTRRAQRRGRGAQALQREPGAAAAAAGAAGAAPHGRRGAPLLGGSAPRPARAHEQALRGDARGMSAVDAQARVTGGLI